MNSGLEESGLMHQAITKADTLIEALAWIRRFRDKITVIKLGGSVLEDPEARRHVLLDIVFMETVGMRPVVVHGGGAREPGQIMNAATLHIDEVGLGRHINGAAKPIGGGRSTVLGHREKNPLKFLLSRHIYRNNSELPFDYCLIN